MAIAQPHPVAGPSRVNLTFRRLKPEFERNVPQVYTHSFQCCSCPSVSALQQHEGKRNRPDVTVQTAMHRSAAAASAPS